MKKRAVFKAISSPLTHWDQSGDIDFRVSDLEPQKQKLDQPEVSVHTLLVVFSVGAFLLNHRSVTVSSSCVKNRSSSNISSQRGQCVVSAVGQTDGRTDRWTDGHPGT